MKTKSYEPRKLKTFSSLQKIRIENPLNKNESIKEMVAQITQNTITMENKCKKLHRFSSQYHQVTHKNTCKNRYHPNHISAESYSKIPESINKNAPLKELAKFICFVSLLLILIYIII